MNGVHTSSLTASPYVGQRRRLALCALSFLLIATSLGCTPVERKVGGSGADRSNLPQEVNAALDRATLLYTGPLNGVQWSKINALSGTDHTIYQAQGVNGRGNKVEMEMTGAGRIIEVEEHGISLGEVPVAVIEALKVKAPDFSPKRVEAIYQIDPAQPVCFGFEGRDANGKEVEIYISADGKPLN